MKSILKPYERIKENYSNPYVLMEKYHSSKELENALHLLLLESKININEVKTLDDLDDVENTLKGELFNYLMNIGYWVIMEKTPWLNNWVNAMGETIERIFPNISRSCNQKGTWIKYFCLYLCRKPFFIKGKKGVTLWEIMLKRRFIHPWFIKNSFFMIPLLLIYIVNVTLPASWLSVLFEETPTIAIICRFLPIICIISCFGLKQEKNNWIIIFNLCYIGLMNILYITYFFFNDLAYDTKLLYWSCFSFALSLLIQVTDVVGKECNQISKDFYKLPFSKFRMLF